MPLALVEEDNETMLPLREDLAIANDCSCEVTDHGGANVTSCSYHLQCYACWAQCFACFHLRDSFLKHITGDLDRWAHPTMHFPISSACTTYMAIPISSRDEKFESWDPGSHSTQLIKEQALNLITRPVCVAFTHRMVSTCWPTISFTKMILLETLCTSETFHIQSSATNTPKPAVPLSFPDQQSLYLVSFPLIVHLLPPRYNVSSIQQTSTFLWGCFHNLTNSSAQSVYIECSHSEFPWALA